MKLEEVKDVEGVVDGGDVAEERSREDADDKCLLAARRRWQGICGLASVELRRATTEGENRSAALIEQSDG